MSVNRKKNRVVYQNKGSICTYRFQKNSLRNITSINVFIKTMAFNLKNNFRKITINFRNVNGGFPNVLVSLSGLIEYYMHHTENIHYITDPTPSDEIKSVIEPLTSKVINHENIEGCVYKFTSAKDVQEYTIALTNILMKKIYATDGVIVSLSWAVNEIMDNVLQHSRSGIGFICMQIHQHKKSVVVSIYDYGQGFYESLKNSKHNPKGNMDAITIAVQKYVTRDNEIGQGIGLWGVSNIVSTNGGSLTISSGRSSINIHHNDSDGIAHATSHINNLPYPGQNNKSSLINFTIRYDKEVDISLFFEDYEFFEYIQRSIENKETDTGKIRLHINEISSGIGTRLSGIEAFNHILNTLNISSQEIEIDFESITFITSSFADEFIGKLVRRLGFTKFNKYITIINCNDLVSKIIDSAIARRLKQ